METYPTKTTLTIMEECLQQPSVVTTSITTKHLLVAQEN